MEITPEPGTQIRDAQMSVEYLCRKFEMLSQQLRHEESAREAAEKHGKQLSAEVASEEAASLQRCTAGTAARSGNDSVLATLKATVKDLDRRAVLEAAKAREEQSAEASLERECAGVSERCQSEAVSCEHALSRLTTQDKEALHERCEHGEVGRHLKRLQADTKVSLENLRIAQQRSLLVTSELHTLESSLESSLRCHANASRDCDAHTLQLQERSRQLGDGESRLEAMVSTLAAIRAGNAAQERRLHLMREEESVSQSQLGGLTQDLKLSQQAARTAGFELQAEVEASNTFVQELKLVEQRRTHEAQEAATYRRSLEEAEATLELARKRTADKRLARDSVEGQLTSLTAEEEGHMAAASNLRRARHVEDLALDDVQSELQIAFKRRESLSEDFTQGAKNREDLLTKLHILRPETDEAEQRCRDLEEQLAQRARDVEAEILQQLRFQQEVVAVSDAVLKAQREESRLEAELHHSAIFQDSAVAATVHVSASSSRPTSRQGSPTRGVASSVSSCCRSTSRPAPDYVSSPSKSAGRHRGPASCMPWASPSPAPRLMAASQLPLKQVR